MVFWCMHVLSFRVGFNFVLYIHIHIHAHTHSHHSLKHTGRHSCNTYTMSLANLPAPLFAQVVRYLYPGEYRQESGLTRTGDYVLCRFEHEAKGMLQCFLSVSKTFRVLVCEMPELFAYVKHTHAYKCPPTYHTALTLNCSRHVKNWRIKNLFESSFRGVAAQLRIIDLHATSISAAGVVTVFQTCPLLEELDVGECQNFSVLRLAVRLKQTILESLVVGRLQKMEVCGTGEGESWVGYRQLFGTDYYKSDLFEFPDSDVGDWRLSDNLSQLYKASKRQGDPAPDEELRKRLAKELKKRLDYLGSPDVLPAVRSIEAIIHSHQRPASIFCMHVNSCENCEIKFAQFVSHDGKGQNAPYDGKTYGQHTCMLCGEARFLCLDCVGYSYHYCADYDCKACVCVKCDGGRSFTAEYESEDLTTWEDLQDTIHFSTVNCCLMDRGLCDFPQQFMILCKDEEACCAGVSGSSQDRCESCGLWQCADCGMYGSKLKWCSTCERRACTDGCLEVEECDSCRTYSCNVCGPARLCKDGCGDVRDVWGRNHAVRHCPTCYLNHPAAAAVVAKRKAHVRKMEDQA